jgi:hypothetical protein
MHDVTALYRAPADAHADALISQAVQFADA